MTSDFSNCSGLLSEKRCGSECVVRESKCCVYSMDRWMGGFMPMCSLAYSQ